MAGLLLMSDIVLIIFSTFLILQFFRRRPTPPLPPGPKKLPLFGNLLDMPREREWLEFAEWGRQYGNLASASIPGQNFVIVNSAKTAVEMLEGKGRIYSDRPSLPMGELVGWESASGFLRYGSRFRSHRKIFHQVVGSTKAVSKFNEMGKAEVHRFLKLLLEKPEDFLHHIRRTAGSIILRITYGYETRSENDPLLSTAETVMGQFTLAASPGGFLVNYIPALRYLPNWFPGSGFKRIALEWGKNLNEMVEGPFQITKREMANGTAEHSVVSELLQDEPNLSQEDLHNIKWVAESFYAGGSDTTVATIYAFFKAMVLYPEVQAKAQAEIDTIIGNGRLPTMEDYESLPYISAIVTEVLRWHPVVPNGFPHRLMEDDVHDGYFIPKGSLVMPNIWYMANDPSVYKDPTVFDPSRYTRTETHEPEPDPRGIIFGFGRRLCPGRLLADASVFLSCAMVLAVFNIMPYTENGKSVMPDLGQQIGVITHPSLFKCNITPRSDRALALIKGH